MLFKVVTVLSVVFLLGGLANCESCEKDQNDNILRLLQAMLNDQKGSGMKDDDNVDAALVELMRVLSDRIKSMTPTPDGNGLIEQLMELLRSYDKHIEPRLTEKERYILSKVKEYLHPETMKDLLELIDKPRGSFNSIMMTIINRLEHKERTRVLEMYTEYLMHTPNDDGGNKNNDTMPCKKESCKKMEYEVEKSPFLEIMKLEGWKYLFEKEYDHKRFAQMVKYIEESHGPMAWFNYLLMATEKNKWIWTVGHQVLYMLEKNHEMQHKVMYFVNNHKDLRKIMMQVSKWVKSHDFNMSTPIVKRIVHVIKMMQFEDYDNSTKKNWLDEYMDWVDCNFGKEEELSTLMKSIGVMLKNERPMMNFLHMLDFDPSAKINVTFQLMFSNRLRCNETVQVPRQTLTDMLYIIMGKKQFCSVTSFTPIQRKSTITEKMGPYPDKISDIPNSGTSIWKIAIYKGTSMVYDDVDLNYMPYNGETVYFYYENTSSSGV